jgi:hypothetical protein
MMIRMVAGPVSSDGQCRREGIRLRLMCPPLVPERSRGVMMPGPRTLPCPCSAACVFPECLILRALGWAGGVPGAGGAGGDGRSLQGQDLGE